MILLFSFRDWQSGKYIKSSQTPTNILLFLSFHFSIIIKNNHIFYLEVVNLGYIYTTLIASIHFFDIFFKSLQGKIFTFVYLVLFMKDTDVIFCRYFPLSYITSSNNSYLRYFEYFPNFSFSVNNFF